jgi:hypothetical protein
MIDDGGNPRRVPLAALLLGVAGLLPTLLALFVRLAAGATPDHSLPLALGALGLLYSALILSFLGGIWWGLAAAQLRPEEAPGLLAVSVVPTVVALVLVGLSLRWPMPASLLLGLAIALTPLVDRALGRMDLTPPWWMRLRWPLSLALGILTIGLGLAIR